MTSQDREQHAADALTDGAAEIGEQAIAVLLHEEVLEHIPVIKLGVAAARAMRSVRDQLLLRKILAMLRGLSSVSREQRADLIRRLEENRDYSETVGEHLVELLDRIDGRRKALMVGAVFAAFARNEIDRPMLYQLTHAIETLPLVVARSGRNLLEEGNYLPGMAAPVPDQRSSKPNARSFTPDLTSLSLLAAAGLAFGQSVYGGISYNLTESGVAFFGKLRLDLVPYDNV
jgi:hypothetical protein